MRACSLKKPRSASSVLAYRPSSGESAASGEGMGFYYKGMAISLSRVSREARACSLCGEVLPNSPRPVFLVGRAARLLIVGQAPGRRVHETGIPWNDPSGDVLREDRKSTRLNSSHLVISYAVFCLQKKNTSQTTPRGDVDARNAAFGQGAH